MKVARRFEMDNLEISDKIVWLSVASATFVYHDKQKCSLAGGPAPNLKNRIPSVEKYLIRAGYEICTHCEKRRTWEALLDTPD